MRVDGRHVGHHFVPVRPLLSDHLIQIERRRYAHRLGGLKGEGEVPSLILRPQRLKVAHHLGEVGVEDGAEGEPVVPAAAKVGNVNGGVVGRLRFAPLEEGVPLGAAVGADQRRQRVALLAGEVVGAQQSTSWAAAGEQLIHGGAVC